MTIYNNYGMDNTNVRSTYYGTDIRTNSMNELKKMYGYFSRKAAQYNELENLTDEAESLTGYNPKFLMILGIIIAAIGSFYLILGPEFGQSAGQVVVWLMMLAAGGGLIALYILRKKKARARLAWINARCDELAEELTDHYNRYGNCPVGIQYTFPGSIERIYSMIQTGRADNIKEAINTITDDEHKEEMERLQRQTAAAAEAAAVNTGIAAANAAEAAAYARYNYFFK